MISVVVLIDEVLTSIVRRINVDHLNLIMVALLKQFKYFQIIALNIKVICGIPVCTLFGAGTQRSCTALLCLAAGIGFTCPVEEEPFLRRIRIITQ
ncbi:hypothetical protein SDC9_201740 [bioreactor metagenome]|uniref:Uncharacterized protein n=1 Tax=bioreactor metagenome TaxID=1076179 RepID=A0A645IRR1_9ZZZZ